MKLEASVDIPFPRQVVFDTYRDLLPQLTEFLPNVKSITVASKQTEGDTTKFLNKWVGGADIPAMAKAFIPGNALEWDDHAEWNATKYTCHWKTVVGAFSEAVDCKGVNHFMELGNGHTRLEIKGEIHVDAKKVKGVPRLLAGTIGSAIEAFLVATIRPNLVSVGEGVAKYLRRQQGK